jgi:hypothetical protein
MTRKSFGREAASALMVFDLVLFWLAANGHADAVDPAKTLMWPTFVIFGGAFGFDKYLKQMMPMQTGGQP